MACVRFISIYVKLIYYKLIHTTDPTCRQIPMFSIFLLLPLPISLCVLNTKTNSYFPYFLLCNSFPFVVLTLLNICNGYLIYTLGYATLYSLNFLRSRNHCGIFSKSILIPTRECWELTDIHLVCKNIYTFDQRQVLKRLKHVGQSICGIYWEHLKCLHPLTIPPQGRTRPFSNAKKKLNVCLQTTAEKPMKIWTCIL